MSENMVRTQVYLPREMYQRLQKRAAENDLTLALQIREALENYLERAGAEDAPILRADDPIFQMIGMFASEEGDLSVNHDHYLYGAPKREIVEPPALVVAREKSPAYAAKRRRPAGERKKR
jgi:hypothetical protein